MRGSPRAPVPWWISAPIALGAFAAIFILELKRPLRKQTLEPKLRHHARNLGVAAAASLAISGIEQPLVQPLCSAVSGRGWGLLPRLDLPVWAEVAMAVILLDYTLYVWHVLTHKVPFLWRFHAPHHVDLDMDSTTAIRFHFGELTLSTAWRAAQVLAIGVTPLSLSVWQVLLFLSIVFHHSNMELPEGLERALNVLIVTPRMHGIHHSTRREETDSNWSSGLSVWDRLHGTLRLDRPQAEITIGVPAYRNPEDVTLPKVLAMPFGEQRPTWSAPSSQA